MVLSVNSSAVPLLEGWPKSWPPVQLPPPSPLTAASSLLWSPPQSRAASTNNAAGSLYSTVLRQGGSPGAGLTQDFQMAFLDQRIALIRFDAGPAPATVAA